jgi:hypothetical protein
MTGKTTKPSSVVLIVRWMARIWSIPSILFIAVMLIGEFSSPHSPPPSSARDLSAFALFPIGVCVGIALAWRWELTGSCISVASFLGFYSLLYLIDGRIPKGPYFALVAVPGFLFLFASLLNHTIQKRKVTE